ARGDVERPGGRESLFRRKPRRHGYSSRKRWKGRNPAGRGQAISIAQGHRGVPVEVGPGRSAMRSILLAMMKSFSCNPLIFLVLRETVARPQPKLISG